MNGGFADGRASSERGYILATVMVFLVVLSMTAFFGAKLARTNVQVVTNLGNQKDALFVAEAGINEALYRMRIASPACVSVSGVGSGTVPAGWPNGTCSGGTFDASLLTQYRGDSCANPVTPGSSPYGLDPCNASSTVRLLFNTAAPVPGLNNTTPTLQAAPYPLKYPNVQIEWSLCTSGDVSAARYGCTAAGTIRRYPVPGCTEQRHIAKVTSTGQVERVDGSVVASRKVVAHVADTGKKQKVFPSILTSLYPCNSGIIMNGGASITAQGPVQVNAGAGQSTTCNQSVQGNNNNSLTVCTSVPSSVADCSLSVSGAGVASGPAYSPLPVTTRSEPAIDPFNDPSDPTKILHPPSPFDPDNGYGTLTAAQFAAANPSVLTSETTVNGVVCPGTYTNPQVCVINSNDTLNPGVYWGGILIGSSASVTLNPGVYVLAGGLGTGSGHTGGGFSLATGGQTVTTTSGGVTFYNTNDPYAASGGSAGSFGLGSGNSTVTLQSSTTNPSAPDGSATNLKGILVFQDRTLSPKPTVDLNGGASGSYSLEGFIYAWDAPTQLRGHANQSSSISLIVGSLTMTGNSNITLGAPATTTAACSSTGYATIAWQDF